MKRFRPFVLVPLLAATLAGRAVVNGGVVVEEVPAVNVVNEPVAVVVNAVAGSLAGVRPDVRLKVCVADVNAFVNDADDPDSTKTVISAIVADKTADEWRPILAKADCCATIMTTLEEAMSAPAPVRRRRNKRLLPADRLSPG